MIVVVPFIFRFDFKGHGLWVCFSRHIFATLIVEMYLPSNPGCGEFLEKLKKSGKKVFMITNSSFNFVYVMFEAILLFCQIFIHDKLQSILTSVTIYLMKTCRGLHH